MLEPRSPFQVLFISCLLFARASIGVAIEPCGLAKLTPSDAPAGGGAFGHSVAIGDYIVVGAFGDSDQGLSAGAAYVYERVGTSWVEQAKVFAPDAAPRQLFGVSVATAGDRLVVGASALNFFGFLDPGAVYVFRPNEPSNCCTAHEAPGCDDEACETSVCENFLSNCCTSGWESVCVDTADLLCNPCREPWVQEAKLSAPQPFDGDRFGSSVSISGELLIVGAPLTQVGRVYVFRLQGEAWVLEAELVGADTQPVDGFGVRVSISGGLAVIGAAGNDGAGENAGAVYVFRRTGTSWSEETLLTASDAGPFTKFGSSVAVLQDTIAVGAGGSNSTGSVYIFRNVNGNWIEEAQFPGTGGSCVALDADSLIAGGRKIGETGTSRLFRRTDSSWTEESALEPTDPEFVDDFGRACDLARGVAVVGSDGAAYVFGTVDDCNTNGLADICDVANALSDDCDDDLVPDDCQPDCDRNGVADSCDIADGRLEDENGDGIPDACEDLIPAVSTWGLIAAALLLLVCARLYFGNR